MKGKIIGVDIGATKIHIGAVENSRVIEEHVFPTARHAPKEKIIADLIKGIESLSGEGFSGIGIGVSGLVDEEKGIIYDLLNIPSWKEVHLKTRLENHFHKPVNITNDANVFAIGEKIFGMGRAFRNMVGVTLGSGFGAGIIINHKLFSGAYSSAGEIGSIPYLDKTEEDYCSGKFFRRELGIGGKEVHRRAERGDRSALVTLNEYGMHLGNALKLIIYVLSPEAILIGGSISKSYNFFEGSLKECLQTFPFTRVMEKVVIQPSDISNISLLGAAALVVSERNEQEQLPEAKEKI